MPQQTTLDHVHAEETIITVLQTKLRSLSQFTVKFVDNVSTENKVQNMGCGNVTATFNIFATWLDSTNGSEGFVPVVRFLACMNSPKDDHVHASNYTK